MSRPPDFAMIGRVIAGKYEISEYIGGGGMGAVYRAHQHSIDKDVALKVMHPEMAADPKFAERFQREARAASRLDHVNSMRVMDFGQEPDGILYIAMELLDGRNLLDLMREEPQIDNERVVSILSQVLAALAVAHGLGIVHRDLKPENVMILASKTDDGDLVDLVKVCDFGIAKLADSRSDDRADRAKEKLTSQGMMIGTPEYMSPEQARGDPLDARSDLYSVGVILFQLITGRIPFEGETALGIALKHVTDEVPKPSSIAPRVDPILEAVCLRAMMKKREDRYATAREMRSELRRAVASETRRATGNERPRLQVVDTPITQNAASASKGTVAGTSSVIVGAATGQSMRGSSRLPWIISLVLVVGMGGAYLAMRAGSTTTGSKESSGQTIASTSAIASVTSAPTASESNALPETPIVADTAIPSSSLTTVATIKTNHFPTAKIAPTAPTATATETATTSAIVATTPPPIATTPPTATVTAPPPVTATATATVIPKPTATAAPVDLASASVGIGAIGTTNGITGTQVRKALGPLSFVKCYRDALKGKGTAATGAATLSLSFDDTGHVTSSSLKGADFLPAMRGCIESVARGAKVEVDTGDASATVTLQFSCK